MNLCAFGKCKLIEHSALFHKNYNMVNGYNAEAVYPRKIEQSQIIDNSLHAILPTVSWNMLRVKCNIK